MEIRIDYLEKDFNKERNYNDNSDKLLCNGLTGKSRYKLTPYYLALVELYIPTFKILIANYQKGQNAIAKLKQNQWMDLTFYEILPMTCFYLCCEN